MAGSGLENLFIKISLIDNLTQPVKGVGKALAQIQQTVMQNSFALTKDFSVLEGSVNKLINFTDPAREFSKALGEVASLDVSPKELEILGNAAKKFAGQFGGNATDVVRAAYDIQSAIPGLTEGALAEFTYQGALLAKATKADIGTITSYTGTMYNIFESEAKKIGEGKWVEQLTGKTAEAVKMFKTTGPAMAQAFSNLGSNGKIAGVSMEEQMAVLGTLQASMGGANAGTAYAGFLNKTADASQKLGLRFTDANKRLLPMSDILDKIRNKFANSRGEINEFNKSKIMKAFGETGGRAVLNLLDKSGQLRESIAKLNAAGDATGALKMAEDMTDPLARFKGTLLALKITIGTGILPVINQVLSIGASVLIGISNLLDRFWLLRGIVTTVIVTFISLAMTWKTIKALISGYKYLKTLYIQFKTLRLAIIKFNIAGKLHIVINRLMTFWHNHFSLATLRATVAQKALALWTGICNVAFKVYRVGCMAATGVSWLLTTGLWAAVTAIWSFTAALLANPITWVVIGVIALIAGLAALVIYWDKVKIAAVACWNWIADAGARCWEFLKLVFSSYMEIWCNAWNELFDAAIAGWDWICNAGAKCWEFLKIGFSAYMNYLSNAWNNITGIAGAAWQWISNAAAGCWELLKSGVTGYYEFWLGIWQKIWEGAGWVFDKITAAWDNTIGLLGKAWKFITGDDANTVEVQNLRQTQINAAPEAVAARRRTNDVPAGGIRNQSTNHTVNYGGVTINTSAPVGPGMLEDLYALNGGF